MTEYAQSLNVQLHNALAQGKAYEALQMEMQALQMQAALKEWSVAAGQFGHKQLMSLREQLQAPSLFWGVDLFRLAMSVANAGSANRILTNVLTSALGKRSRPESAVDVQEDVSGVRCHYSRKLGHYKWDCPNKPQGPPKK